jgi:hypothetical protein
MKVRNGQVLQFKACGWDIYDRHEGTPADGTIVRVCAPYGCPKPNTMGHCYVETLDGRFLGLVHTNSLHRPI